MNLFLPKSTVELIEKVTNSQRHPGLQLDKFSVPGDQTAQKAALAKVCNIPGDSSLLKEVTERRNNLLTTLPGASSFRCTTTGPLTLHLARASALENAGICLHPIYGLAYLPGSGLKGMARAYAETVWLPAQTDQKQAWRQIEDVFGWAPNPDRRQQINDPQHPAEVRRKDSNGPESPEIKASSGNIVFHEAWPESWPPLIVDIVNNHHPHYYTGETSKRDEQGRCNDCKFRPDDPNAHPPGDWENPVPVYFLAVKPGTTFTFFLSKRRSDVPDELTKVAQEWLLGALCHLGAGAKTNSGYGAFRPAERSPPALPSQKRAVFETTLELVTPAFLAGANQQAEDCDLRPATLRGLLRWWWRTMHAGFLDVKTLRALEAAIWGDTKSGGAVRIILEPISPVKPLLYNKQIKAKSDDNHKKSSYGIPSETNPKKIIPGLWYVSYGMDEKNHQRYYLEPGAKWRLWLIACPTQFFVNRSDVNDPRNARQISSEQILRQAQAALWLLCHFGGIGSKARKGFGSLSTSLPNTSLETCKQAAQQLRLQLALPNSFDEHRAKSPSLEQMLGPVEVNFSWPEVWTVLDQLGFAYESAAHQRAHDTGKRALGLPRQIHGPRRTPLPHQNPAKHRPPQRLDGPKGGRHASPIHIHVDRGQVGWVIRVCAFPAAHLPDLATSLKFLEEFLKELANDLQRRSQLPPLQTVPGSAVSPARPITGPQPVRVKFLGAHAKLKGAFWVQEAGKKRGLLKYGTPPPQLPAINSDIDVYATNDNPNSPEYRWDPPPPTNPPRSGPGGQRSRGRR